MTTVTPEQSERLELIKQITGMFWNVRDELKDKTLDELRALCVRDIRPFAVCCLNVTGDLNLGIMMRTASLLGAEKFIVYGRRGYDARTTVGAQNYIEVVKAGRIIPFKLELDYTDFFDVMAAYNYHPVFMETGGTPINEFHFVNTFQDTDPCLVFGNEGLGIPPELMVGHPIVSVPQCGVLRSYNVSAAASIAMYECAMQVSGQRKF